MRRVMIFDGMNLFLRNFAVVPEMDSNGRPIGGFVGSLRSIKALVRDQQPDRVFVCWDGVGGSAKRRGMFAEYKSGRKPRLNRELGEDESVDESARNLHEQIVLTKEALGYLCVTQIELQGTEADDVVAYLCSCLPSLLSDPVITIVSTDNDFLQLVSPAVSVYSPTKKETYTVDTISSTYGVHHANFVYLKALAIGDKSDNLPKIKGLGPKRFVKMFPFIAERETSLSELLEFCKGKDGKRDVKYRAFLESADDVKKCVDLAQLQCPLVSAEGARSTREAVQTRPPFNSSDFMLMLLRNGVTIRDGDMISTFSSLKMRTSKAT